MEAQKTSNNTAIILTIAIALVIIVAMVCAMGVWMVQRTMSFNEKLLESRIAEERANTAQRNLPLATPVAPASTPVVEKPAVSPAPAPVAKPAPKPVAVKADKPVQKSVKPAPKEAKQPVLQPPQEKPNAPVGLDGQPLNRITLPVGKDDLEWQL